MGIKAKININININISQMLWPLRQIIVVCSPLVLMACAATSSINMKKYMAAGMTQQLREHTAFPEAPSSVPNIHIRCLTMAYHPSFSGSSFSPDTLVHKLKITKTRSLLKSTVFL